MEQGFLIDTNAVIDYLNAAFPAAGMDFMNRLINQIPHLSVITRIELLSFQTDNTDDYRLLEEFISAAIIYNLEEPIITLTIEIRKQIKIKLPDAIIAATALYNNLTLITRNKADFKNVPALKITNPHEF